MIPLVPHPSTPDAARQVSALAERAGAELHLRWLFRGDLATMRVPAPETPRRADHLWEHTCAEAFVAAEDAAGYVELNVAPSRAWAAYAFTRYREGEPLATAACAPRIEVRRDGDALAIDAHVALAALGNAYVNAALTIGLTAVVESTDGRVSYWALCHPAAKPDFHHTEGFTLRLPAPPDGARRAAP